MTYGSRPLTPAEKYYAFLDRSHPMNLMLVAELDRCFPIDQVAVRWADFRTLRSVPRLRVHEDLTMSDGPPADGDFRGTDLSSELWDQELSRESRQPFGLDRPMQLLYLTSEAEQRSRVVFIVHHALVDGRVGIGDLQLFVRSLDGQPVPSQRGLPVALPSTRSFPWQTDREQLSSTLRDIVERNDAAGPPEPAAWPRPAAERDPRFFSLSVEDARTDAFLACARAHGTRAYPAIAAAWLIAIAGRLCEPPSPVLQLATPVDLAVPVDDADHATAPFISVVTNRHRVVPSTPWTLAVEIAADLQASMERGDGELFFHLARAKSIGDLDTGADLVARSVAAAPPSVSVTNLGVIDPGSDPAWLRSLCGYLAATPNQVIFVSGTGYRGRLIHSVSTDDSQLPAETSRALVEDYQRLVGTMSQG